MPFSPKGAVVRPAWGRSFAVSGKMPQRNTRRARGKPVSRLSETLAAVPRPCSAASYEFGRDGRRRKAETAAGRERPPRKRPSLAQPGLSGRSLPGLFLAGRPCGSQGHGGIPRGARDRHEPPSGCAARVEVQPCEPPRNGKCADRLARRAEYHTRDRGVDRLYRKLVLFQSANRKRTCTCWERIRVR